MTLRLGIIGSGGMGLTWAEAARLIGPERVRVVAIAGGTRAGELSARFGVDAEPSVDALLARPDVDAVLVASPQPTHHGYVLAAAAGGRHILCEKPFASTLAQADEMVAAAERARVTLGVVSQHRFRPTPMAAKRLIDEGVIGEVRMAQVRGVMAPWDMPRANLPWADLGAHLCDIVRWLVGAEVSLVGAQFHDFGAGDPPKQTAFVIVRFASGALAHIWFSYEISQPGLGSIMQFLVTGSKAMIELDSYVHCRLSDEQGWRTIAEQPAPDPYDPLDPIRMEQYVNQLADFLDAVRDGRPPRVDGHEGRAVMAMLEAALRSDETGTFVRPG
jgi:myo-inositol 2-dehydrogenase/D-chiro-inositol 1-dehydrogenase